ncbi:MAG: MFS transporter [candidate division Zixibacteria bacterium]|nr:MFS transporter [candidate division Zixibacteria bacterium]
MLSRSIAYFRQFDRSLWILATGWFVSALGFAAAIPFIAIYFNEAYGVSITTIGLFYGLMAVVRSLFQMVAGEVSDRIERRQLLIYSQMCRAVAFVLIAVGISCDWGVWWTAGVLLVNSVFGAIFQPVANAMVSDILPDKQRLDGYAVTRSAGNLGWAAGPAIGGFLAKSSYALLFYIAAVLTIVSALIFLFFLVSPKVARVLDRFKLSDLVAIKDDPYLAWHSILIFLLYLVVAQLIAPFSLYAVQIVGISEAQLGFLYMMNGLIVVAFQIPVTRMLSGLRFTTQLILGALVYAVGYSMIGLWAGFNFFMIAMVVVTVAEVFMSPPSLALTARLAPEGRMGRYMGIYGFFVASGWSFGPLYGGLILDHFYKSPAICWLLISSLAVVSAIGYMVFKRALPAHFDNAVSSTRA